LTGKTNAAISPAVENYAVVRSSRGRDIHAACGQLRATTA